MYWRRRWTMFSYLVYMDVRVNPKYRIQSRMSLTLQPAPGFLVPRLGQDFQDGATDSFIQICDFWRLLRILVVVLRLLSWSVASGYTRDANVDSYVIIMFDPVFCYMSFFSWKNLHRIRHSSIWIIRTGLPKVATDARCPEKLRISIPPEPIRTWLLFVSNFYK